MNPETGLLDTLHLQLHDRLLRKWYPRVIDREAGGYFTNLRHDWSLEPEQEKMIVTQARHVWTTSKAAAFVDHPAVYEQYARHGYRFLREKMWDPVHGGFFQIRSRDGGWSDVRGWRDEKRTYGNAFGVYALASLYELTHEAEVLDGARQAFLWIEEHAHDPVYGGYFQFMTREGTPFDRSSNYTSIASDRNEVGYKDQNSSIHLLEAYTELYRVWKDYGLRRQLNDLLVLIRDTMVTSRGYLTLFFLPDWTPVSFRDAPEAVRQENYGLDHVSFGHDYETAFLMLEASHALGLERDTRTLTVAKRMMDHALENGWDNETGGFVDGGYYLTPDAGCTTIRPTKNWWAQAEALNALLLFSNIFPDERKYREYFAREWEYVDRYVLDHEGGDWYEGGVDREPEFKRGRKSHIWKCTYHTSRALMNCITMLAGPHEASRGPQMARRKSEMDGFLQWWKATAQLVGG